MSSRIERAIAKFEEINDYVMKKVTDGTRHGNLSTRWKVALVLTGAVSLTALSIATFACFSIGSSLFGLSLAARTLLILGSTFNLFCVTGIFTCLHIDRNFHNTYF